MQLKPTLMFVLKASVVGLAAAFVILIWRQEFGLHAPVEIHETPTAVPALAHAGRGPYSYALAVEKAIPAVVNINTAKVVTVRPNPYMEDPVLRQFFGRTPDDLIRP